MFYFVFYFSFALFFYFCVIFPSTFSLFLFLSICRPPLLPVLLVEPCRPDHLPAAAQRRHGAGPQRKPTHFQQGGVHHAQIGVPRRHHAWWVRYPAKYHRSTTSPPQLEGLFFKFENGVHSLWFPPSWVSAATASPQRDTKHDEVHVCPFSMKEIWDGSTSMTGHVNVFDVGGFL